MPPAPPSPRANPVYRPLPVGGTRELTFTIEPVPAQPGVERFYRHQFDAAEPLALAVRRVCVVELGHALGALESDDRSAGIHATRKALKRTRAMLRLVRDRVGDPAYRAENVALRDASRRISDVRSAFVAVRTAEQLASQVPVLIPPAVGARLVAVLDDRRLGMERRVGAEIAGSVARPIHDSMARIGLWAAQDPVPRYLTGPRLSISDDFSSVAHGIERVYRRGRRAMGGAYDRRTIESFHEWRKRVRYLRYQIEALHLMWPAVLGELADELALLAELLGAEHDLAELGDLIEREPDILPVAAHRASLARGIAERRVALQHDAHGLGRRVYAEAPGPFVERLGTYWAVWKHQTKT